MTAPWIFAASVVALMAFVSYTTVRSGLALQTWTPHSNLLLGGLDNAVRLILVALCVLLGLTVGPGPGALGWYTSHLGQNLALGVAVGLVLATGLKEGGRLAERRWGAAVFSSKLLQCILPIDRREWAGVILALLPAAALEELLFRSLPLGGMAWLVPPWWLLWPLSLLFGLLHWPQGGWGVVGSALAAVVFSLLFLATESLWVPLAAHYSMNIAQLFFAQRSGLKPVREP